MPKHETKYHLEEEFREFFEFLREDKVSVGYSPIFREFTILLKYTSAVQALIFCPWTGKKFPPSLRDEYFDTLENEFGFDDPGLDDVIEGNVPAEMLSETWWIKRKL